MKRETTIDSSQAAVNHARNDLGNGQGRTVSPAARATRSRCCCILIWLLAGPLARADDDVLNTVIEAQKSRVEVIASAMEPTIAVFEAGGEGGGSGVVISPDGYAVTNFHVVQPCGKYMQCGMPDGELYDAVVVGVDPTGDVALIKLTGRDDFPVAKFGDSDDLRIGDWCFTVGNPFLLATDFQPSVAYGIVSGVHRYQYPAGTLLEYADCIQTDAAINPGNSGGPLFDAAGKLIGINGRCSFEKRGRVNVGVGYSISINQVKKFLGYLHSGRIVDHATLGATVATDEDGRVIVTNILESSDAFRRGLRFNDEIVSFGGFSTRTANSLKNVLGTFPRGWRVPLSYRRDGQQFDVTVRLSGVHAREELLAKVQGARRIQPEGPKPRERPTPGEKRPEIPRQPRVQPQRVIPENIRDQIVERNGYANYYFNQLHRDRVWNALVGRAGSFSERGEWTLIGVTSEDDAFEIVLRDDEALATMADGPHRIDLKKGVEAQMRQYLLPNGEIAFGLPPVEGTLLALAMWRRILVDEPAKFGEVYYLGTAPLTGEEELTDVLVATRDVVENQLYFDVASGRLLALESFPDADTDPFEVFFHEETDHDGRKVPSRLTVRLGDTVLGEYHVKQHMFTKVVNGAES